MMYVNISIVPFVTFLCRYTLFFIKDVKNFVNKNFFCLNLKDKMFDILRPFDDTENENKAIKESIHI